MTLYHPTPLVLLLSSNGECTQQAGEWRAARPLRLEIRNKKRFVPFIQYLLKYFAYN
jgi:hypothetical protein